METVNDVLSKVLSTLGLERRLREHTLSSLWPSFVPGAVADRTRPLFIDAERNLVVSVADASTGQELSMLKSKILAKLIPAARSLGIEIRGLRTDMKYFRSLTADSSSPVAEITPPPRPDDAQLQSVQLSELDKRQIEQLRYELFNKEEPGASGSVQHKILRLFELELRIKKWRLEQGFPVCHQCGNPAERLHERVCKDGKELHLCLECLCVGWNHLNQIEG